MVAAANVSAEPAVAVKTTETATPAATPAVAPEAATTAPVAAARAAAEPSAAPPVAAAVPSASPAAAVVPSTPAPAAAVPPVEPEPSPVVVASVAPETAAPAATVAQPAVVADEAGARAAVNAWLAAWNNRNADEFVAAYSAGFKPEDGTDHAAWVQSVRAGLDVPRPRVLQISGLSFELPTASSADGAPMAIARFRESSVAGVLRITKLKRLDLRHDGQRWVIVEEGSGL